jgi:hypothetical protein
MSSDCALWIQDIRVFSHYLRIQMNSQMSTKSLLDCLRTMYFINIATFPTNLLEETFYYVRAIVQARMRRQLITTQLFAIILPMRALPILQNLIGDH